MKTKTERLPFNGGAIVLNVPVSWVHRKGDSSHTGVMLSDGTEDGAVMRMSVVSCDMGDALRPEDILAKARRPEDARIESLSEDKALLTYSVLGPNGTKTYFWHVAVASITERMFILIVSYSVPVSRTSEASVCEELELLDGEMRGSPFSIDLTQWLQDKYWKE